MPRRAVKSRLLAPPSPPDMQRFDAIPELVYPSNTSQYHASHRIWPHGRRPTHNIADPTTPSAPSRTKHGVPSRRHQEGRTGRTTVWKSMVL
ncbi:hypothetical protein SNOG_09132 [Parastagonospora nodorum SN15]|uniref:Uncharacterized protein n=1 Tax=Phaeosphaeria nodorum (strain SN15 / ATCC MYA-4574 / FGSC 10173) TaxID=321614 RepID=Q0UGI2_PHANO|nr:hypothetical protein SNOG_09132 [Parastagonospora nodorum SN15]EAT83324.1 hypothetical protein SNOG_09132 [Parastagonospora nodorum SN15]